MRDRGLAIGDWRLAMGVQRCLVRFLILPAMLMRSPFSKAFVRRTGVALERSAWVSASLENLAVRQSGGARLLTSREVRVSGHQAAREDARPTVWFPTVRSGMRAAFP